MRNFIIIATLFLLGCSKEFYNTQVPYYKLTEVSKTWFTDLNKGDTLTFISNQNRTRKYVVYDISQTKEEYADHYWTTGGSTIYFYFDQRTISFQRIGSFSKITEIKIYAFAPDTTDLRKPSPSETGIAKSFFQFDDYIGQPIGSSINILTDFSSPPHFTSFTIGSKSFNDVIEFSCGCTSPYYDNGWNRWNTLNKIRYSKAKGFINFEMTTGEIWNRQF